MMRAGKDYGVEVIRAYQFKRVGDVIFPNGIERDRLVQCGFVKRRAAPEEEAVNVVSINQKKPKLRLK